MDEEKLLAALEAEYSRRMEAMNAFQAQKEQLALQEKHLKAGLSPNILTNAKEAISSTANDLVNGASLGWADEAAGLISPKVRDDMRAQREVSSALTPKIQMANELVGGVAPMAIPGANAAKLLSLRGVGTGALYGALAGGGNAADGDGFSGATAGGVAGAVGAPILGAAGKGIAAVASKTPEVMAAGGRVIGSAKNAIADLANALSAQGEAGAILPKMPMASKGDPLSGVLTPGEKYLLSTATKEGWNKEQLNSALTNWVKSRQGVNEYTLADEMLSNPEMQGSVKTRINYLASQPGSRDAVTSVTNPRNLARAQRTTSAIEDVANTPLPKDDTAKAVFDFVDSVKGHVEGLKQQRSAEGNANYDIAIKATPGKLGGRYQAVAKLVDPDKNPLISQAISDVMAAEPKSRFLGKDSLQMLNMAKMRLDDLAKNYGTPGHEGFNNIKAKAAKDAANKITSTLDAINPHYAKAREAWADASEGINEIAGRKWGAKKQMGLFQKILNVQEAQDPMLVFKALNSLQPSQIANMKSLLPKELQGKMEDAVLQSLKNKIRESADGGQSPVKQIWDLREDSSLSRDWLKAALGKEKYKQLAPKLDAELKMHKTNQASEVGSPTQTRLAIAAEEKKPGFVNSMFGAGAKIIDKIVKNSSEPTDEMRRQLAEILFSDQAWRSVPKVTKAMESKEYARALAQALMPKGQMVGQSGGVYASGELGGR